VPQLTLARDAYDDIVRHGYDGDEEEICGILAGQYGEYGEDAESVAHEIHPVENVADRPAVRYAMDPEEQFAVIERIENAGLDVVGFYHSHPAGGVVPSETDREQATWTGYSYAICAFDGYPYLGSWRWTGERFEREAVALIQE
jgi:proteasome lid subunit RPN8/RPN11